MLKNHNSQYFDLWAKKYINLPDENSFHLRYVSKLIREKYPLIINKKNLKIVSLGIGNGRLLSALNISNSEIIGLDVSQEQLNLARKKLQNKKTKINLFQHDLEKPLPIENSSADMVISNATIHHIKNKKSLFKEIYRILKPKGIFLFFDFYFEKIERDTKKKVLEKQKEIPLKANKFINSIKKEYNLMPSFLHKNHPQEYHKSPQYLIRLLKEINLKNCEVIPTFYLKYLGIGGTK